MVVVDRSRERIEETRSLVREMLSEIGITMNPHKSIISEVKYGIMYLGVKIYPHYTCLSKRKIGRLWLTSRHFVTVEKAFRSCASRKGMLNRYRGRHLSMRWYMSLQPEIREHLKMESDGRFRIVGKPKTDNTVLRSIVLYREGA